MMENDFFIPYDFLLLMLVIVVMVTTVVNGCCAYKKWRLHRLTNPRKDYCRPNGHSGHHRTHRIDRVDGYSANH